MPAKAEVNNYRCVTIRDKHSSFRKITSCSYRQADFWKCFVVFKPMMWAGGVNQKQTSVPQWVRIVRKWNKKYIRYINTWLLRTQVHFTNTCITSGPAKVMGEKSCSLKNNGIFSKPMVFLKNQCRLTSDLLWKSRAKVGSSGKKGNFNMICWGLGIFKRKFKMY